MDESRKRSTSFPPKTLAFIDSVSREQNMMEKQDLILEVCETLETRFGKHLEERATALHLRTTKEVTMAVEMYLSYRKLYPNHNFQQSKTKEKEVEERGDRDNES